MWYFWYVAMVFAVQTYAMTDKEVQADFTKRVLQCSVKNPIPFVELMNLQKLIVPKEMKTKCLLLCAYKSMKVIGDKGMYDTEVARKNAELVAGGDEDRLKRGLKVVDECALINKKAVSDGDKGCDRAGLLFGCILEAAPKNGFALTAKSAGIKMI